ASIDRDERDPAGKGVSADAETILREPRISGDNVRIDGDEPRAIGRQIDALQHRVQRYRNGRGAQDRHAVMGLTNAQVVDMKASLARGHGREIQPEPGQETGDSNARHLERSRSVETDAVAGRALVIDRNSL